MPPRAAAPPKGKRLTEDELAKQLGITVATVKKWRKEKRGPDWWKGDGTRGAVRYPESWVEEWENSHRVRMTV